MCPASTVLIVTPDERVDSDLAMTEAFIDSTNETMEKPEAIHEHDEKCQSHTQRGSLGEASAFDAVHTRFA